MSFLVFLFIGFGLGFITSESTQPLQGCDELLADISAELTPSGWVPVDDAELPDVRITVWGQEATGVVRYEIFATTAPPAQIANRVWTKGECRTVNNEVATHWSTVKE